jgi:hypothetical protein
MDYSPPLDHQKNQGTTSILEKINWLIKGFIYPIWSRPYYREATVKPMGAALVFLLAFAALQAIVTTSSVALSLSQFGREIEAAYLKGEVPNISIENGIATASGSGQYMIESGRSIIAVDTTGETQEIDTYRFSEGFLLTRTELHLVNEDGYQVLPLIDLNRTFGNPIVLDAESVTGFWSGFSFVINILVLGGGYLFFSLGRFIYLALLGLIVWGAVSINNKGYDFGKILITGIYANVPTTYLMFILRKLGIRFFGLRGVFLFVIWGIAIAYVLKEGTPIQSQSPDDT